MFRRLTLITIALGLTFTLGAAIGCTKSKTSTPATTTTVTPPPLTAVQVVSKVSDTLDKISAFHCILDQIGGGTPIGMGLEMTRVEGDIVKPDRIQASLTGTVSGMSMTVQMISVGEVTYMTNPLTGKWEALPSQFAVLSVFNPNTGITAIMRGITDLTKLVDEQTGGVLCYHLSGSIDSEKLAPITGSSVKGIVVNVELWVGKDDFSLRSIKLTGKITETEVPGIIRTLTLSNFNEAVNIELPQ